MKIYEYQTWMNIDNSTVEINVQYTAEKPYRDWNDEPAFMGETDCVSLKLDKIEVPAGALRDFLFDKLDFDTMIHEAFN